MLTMTLIDLTPALTCFEKDYTDDSANDDDQAPSYEVRFPGDDNNGGTGKVWPNIVVGEDEAMRAKSDMHAFAMAEDPFNQLVEQVEATQKKASTADLELLRSTWTTTVGMTVSFCGFQVLQLHKLDLIQKKGHSVYTAILNSC